MTKTNTIEAIRSLNPTASTEFLDGFSPSELDAYLDRLNRLQAIEAAGIPVPSEAERHSPLETPAVEEADRLPFPNFDHE